MEKNYEQKKAEIIANIEHAIDSAMVDDMRAAIEILESVKVGGDPFLEVYGDQKYMLLSLVFVAGMAEGKRIEREKHKR